MLPTPAQADELRANASGPHSLTGIAFNAPTGLDLTELPDRREVRAKGQASAGGVGTARGPAGMYQAAAFGLDGGAPLLTEETRAEFSRIHSAGTDLVTGETDHAFGLGFQALGLKYASVGADAFGHSGAAGSQAFADPRNGVAYGYTRRRFALPGGAAPENERLVAAVERAVRKRR